MMIRKGRPVLASLLTGTVLLSGQFSYASQATDLLLSKAHSLEGRGLMDLAAHSWEQVLLAEPNNAEALAGLARYAKMNGKKADADRYLERLRAIDPQNPAISRIDSMRSLDQQRGLLDEAQRLAQKKDFDGAMRIYRQVFNNEPPPGNWAIAYYETEAATAGGWEDATAALKRWVDKYPGSPEYSLALGRLWTYHPRTRQQGIELLEKVKGDAGLMSKARSAWRQALIWDAGNPASIPSLRAYLALYPDTELAKLLGQDEKVIQASAPKPSQPAESPRNGQGYKALRSGKLKDAEGDFSSALKTAPRDPAALSGLGYVRMKEQDFSAAVPLFEQASAAKPKDKSISSALETAKFWKYMQQGSVSLNNNHFGEAAEAFKQAVALKPQNTDAVRALAGTYARQGNAALAWPLYQQLAQSASATADDWFGLVKAQADSGNPQDALRSWNQAPKTSQNAWMKDAGHVALLAFIRADAGDEDGARALAAQGEQLLANASGEPTSGVALEYAGLYLRLHQPALAVERFEQITRKDPGSSEAWSGLLSAYVQSGDLDRAADTLERIPPGDYQKALGRPEFLRSVAGLNIALNRYDRAEVYLRKAVEIENHNGKKTDSATLFQLADILSHNGKSVEAEETLRKVVDAQPGNAGAWSSLLSLLHSDKKDKLAYQLLQSMPENVLISLRDDPAFIGVQAGVYSGVGRANEARQMIDKAVSRFESEGIPVPSDLALQQAWVLLNTPGSDRELYSILSRYSSSPNLTAAQAKDFNSIWSIWCQRRAAEAADRGDLNNAVSILRAASKVVPQDPRIEGTLAGTYLKAGDTKSAFLVYKNWGMKEASADDFSGAIGSALAVQDSDTAQKWLTRALQKYPRNARLLSLAGKQAAQRGDYEKAKMLLREALASLPPDQTQNTTVTAEADSAKAKQVLGALMLGNRGEDDGPVQSAVSSAPSWKREQPLASNRYAQSDDGYGPAIRRSTGERGTGSDLSAAAPRPTAYATPMNDIEVVPSRRTTRSEESVPQENTARTSPYTRSNDADLLPLPKVTTETAKLDPVNPASDQVGQPTLEQQINNDLGAIENRNSPYFTNGAAFRGRTGRSGVDKLMTEQANIEVSTTVGNQVRLSLVAKPTYLDSGSPSATESNAFGSSVANGASTETTAFGVGAEAQLSTRSMGVRLGLSPSNFLVQNWVGGFRLNPGHGPFTLLLSRDNVQDTKLSFAGERDSGTNQVWGGVMANSASVIGNWGTDKSGFYTIAGYQDLRGKNVQQNSQINVTTGGYFKILSRAEGSLTAGLNFSAMHYDKNLRYFTLGQGGYFSPQQYFLTNVPLRWTGSWNRVLQYSISASLGVQHFQEDKSLYFPTKPLLQAGAGNLTYPSMSSTGGNYNLDFRLGYQVAPQWLLGAFASVGNSRDYRNTSAGVFLRYLFQPRPFSSEINADSVPDWKGAQPFGLPMSF
jgi:cellulose synthase operon protein C